MNGNIKYRKFDREDIGMLIKWQLYSEPNIPTLAMVCLGAGKNKLEVIIVDESKGGNTDLLIGSPEVGSYWIVDYHDCFEVLDGLGISEINEAELPFYIDQLLEFEDVFTTAGYPLPGDILDLKVPPLKQLSRE